MAYSKVVVKSSDRNICGGKTSWTVEIEKGHYPVTFKSFQKRNYYYKPLSS